MKPLQFLNAVWWEKISLLRLPAQRRQGSIAPFFYKQRLPCSPSLFSPDIFAQNRSPPTHKSVYISLNKTMEPNHVSIEQAIY
jgi:hypothetical protein